MYGPSGEASSSSNHRTSSTLSSFWWVGWGQELWWSLDVLFQGGNKITWLLLLGPMAVAGHALGILPEAACFTLSGLALIPCAERLSFITEQVAEHTNGTIGALLNATFGNAPELLIAVSALRAGYYRVVQLAMLGSMLTNLILVFGVACLIGGLRWQVQELRIVSGNVSVTMLLVATAGSLLPATLALAGQFRESKSTSTAISSTTEAEAVNSSTTLPDDGYLPPSPEEIAFCRFNAAIMLSLYLCYLLFQLRTHKEEFDNETSPSATGTGAVRHSSSRAKYNLFCLGVMRRTKRSIRGITGCHHTGSLDQQPLRTIKHSGSDRALIISHEHVDKEVKVDENGDLGHILEEGDSSHNDETELLLTGGVTDHDIEGKKQSRLRHRNELLVEMDGAEQIHGDEKNGQAIIVAASDVQAKISLRVGVLWLFIITLCISAMSDILVSTIDGFAQRMQTSEVFTSMVIIPFFSNVAEQVSAFIFAYRNEMDLCVGVTVGSAIQVATFVLPGSVLIGMVLDRSMTLYFHAYETVCLFFGVLVVAAILQGGTTNWLVGLMLIGIYLMIAGGIWFHELESLTVDAQEIFDQASHTNA